MKLTVKGVEVLRKTPGRYGDGHGLVLQVVNPNNVNWQFHYQRNGRPHAMGLGPLWAVGLKQARQRAYEARQLLFKGIDPLEHKRATKNEPKRQDIVARWQYFLGRNIEPTCYLYRHYHPNGDLLYVGISNEPIERQRKHSEESHWASQVCHIVIEPFSTREEALAAEQRAITNEYPKFNLAFNDRSLPKAIRRLTKSHLGLTTTPLDLNAVGLTHAPVRPKNGGKQ